MRDNGLQLTKYNVVLILVSNGEMWNYYNLLIFD